MNYFYDVLSSDLQNYIIQIASAPTIQRIWRGYYACWKHALDIASKYADDDLLDKTHEFHQFNPMDPLTALELEFCVKHSLIERRTWIWDEFINIIDYGLWMDEYTGGPGAKYKRRVRAAKEKLEEKIERAYINLLKD